MRLMEELSTLSVPAEYTHSTDEHSTDEHTSRAPGESGQQRRQSRVSNVNLRPFAAVHVSPPPAFLPTRPPTVPSRRFAPPQVGSLLGFVASVCAQTPPPLLDPPRPY